MADKHILVATADLTALADYGRALGTAWDVTPISDAAAALADLAAYPRNMIVADYDWPQGNGIELLDRVKTEHPHVVRILLVAEAERERRTSEVQGSHLILSKPCSESILRGAVERAMAINIWLANESLRDLVSRLRTFPIVPSLYLEIVGALQTPNTTTAEIGAIIAKDMAMMTKLLQVTNSACFGLQRKISDPVEAVGILGFETVKSMVMTLKLLSQYDKVKPVFFSIDRLWRHSTEVARLARRLALTQTNDPVLGESAFTAGLMHDLGKLILASNFHDQYGGAQTLARKQQIPLEVVEKEIFGASHGELGAYLLGIWGMPQDLVECAALHHHPARSQAKYFTALTAVHVANALHHEVKPDKEGYVPAKVDMDYLAELGLADQITPWREIAQGGDSGGTQFRTRTGDTKTFKKGGTEFRARSEDTKRYKKPVANKLKLVPVAAPPAVPVESPRFPWLHAGLTLVVFATCIWIVSQTLVQKETAPAAETAVIAPKTPAVKLISAASLPAATPVKATNQPATELPMASFLVDTNSDADEPPPAPLTPKELAFDRLQLQGIYFSKASPSAVINGNWVHARDRLPAGATVVAIGPSSVTLEFENEQKILALK